LPNYSFYAIALCLPLSTITIINLHQQAPYLAFLDIVKGRRKSLPCDAVFQYYTVGECFQE